MFIFYIFGTKIDKCRQVYSDYVYTHKIIKKGGCGSSMYVFTKEKPIEKIKIERRDRWIEPSKVEYEEVITQTGMR